MAQSNNATKTFRRGHWGPLTQSAAMALSRRRWRRQVLPQLRADRPGDQALPRHRLHRHRRARSGGARVIKVGRLSATRTEDGSYQIDPAELHRVYPMTGESNGKTQRFDTPGAAGVLPAVSP